MHLFSDTLEVYTKFNIKLNNMSTFRFTPVQASRISSNARFQVVTPGCSTL